MAQLAHNINAEQSVINFLHLFPDDYIFTGRADFMVRCEELELLIGQAEIMPREILRSPQE